MILADKIIALRKKAGWSQEELARQLDVSRQSVSKWEGAQSVPDMERILQLSRLFGVSTDYLLKDEMECPGTAPLPDEAGALRRVTMEEAAAYLERGWRNAPWMGLATLLCIISPTPLLMLAGLSRTPGLPLGEQTAVGLGIIALVTLVAAAVALFLICDARGAELRFLEKEPFETEYGVAGMVRERRKAFRPRYTRLNITGVLLCILSVVPVFAVTAALPAGAEDGLWYAAAVCCLLWLAGMGMFAFVYGGTCWEATECLLEEGDYTRRNKARRHLVEAVSMAYWLVVTAGYLAYSLTTGSWEHSWAVWPVAGLLYGAAMAFLNLLDAPRREGEG